MKHYVEFSLADGSTMMVEVEEETLSPTKPDGVQERAGAIKRGIHAGAAVEKAKETFEAALDKIKPAASTIISKLRDVADSPEQIAVEFGVKLTAETQHDGVLEPGRVQSRDDRRGTGRAPHTACSRPQLY